MLRTLAQSPISRDHGFPNSQWIEPRNWTRPSADCDSGYAIAPAVQQGAQRAHSILIARHVSPTGSIAPPRASLFGCRGGQRGHPFHSRDVAAHKTWQIQAQGIQALREYWYAMAGIAIMNERLMRTTAPWDTGMLILRLPCAMQIDGGITFTEPTAIISGIVEGMEDVSGAHWPVLLCPTQLLSN